PFRWFLIPLTQREGLQVADELADALRFETVKDYEDWVARLRRFPVFVDQTIALMKKGIRARMALPKVTMQRVPNQIDKQLVAQPQDSPFYKPFTHYPAAFPESARTRLSGQAREAIDAA